MTALFAQRSVRATATELVEMILDRGSFEPWAAGKLANVAGDSEYASECASARCNTGMDESVVVGEGRISGRRVALIVSEYAFMGGSVGVAAAERIVAAVETATELELPLLALPASGGTRMQEGTLAFLQMIKIAAAVTDHKRAGHPYIVYLRHPTTGGVFASWGSLGHVTFAENAALIGFLGPRVYEALNGEQFPSGVQTSENLYAYGLLDAVVPPSQLADLLRRTLETLDAGRALTTVDKLLQLSPPVSSIDPWEAVLASRRSFRPGARWLLHTMATSMVPLNGTGHGETDYGIILCLARIGAVSCVYVGHSKGGVNPVAIGPAALRVARRGMRLAAELDLPFVTAIDTAGAELSPSAEQGGLSGEIAYCLAEMVTLPTPTVSVVIGQGTGGAALALFPADRVIFAENGWLSPLPPEGASAIVHRDVLHAAAMASNQRIDSHSLLGAGVADVVVAEQVDGADAPLRFCSRIAHAVRQELESLLSEDNHARYSQRRNRYRTLGL